MPTNQPEWKLIANLGDANPLDYGGYLVFIDQTGVYAPEGELIDPPSLDEGDKAEVFRFSLDRCTYVNGILSDNKYHPDHPAWFASHGDLPNVAATMGQTVEKYIEWLTSEDAIKRAMAYYDIGMYHGWRNMDDYPLKLTRVELLKRYIWLHNSLKSLRGHHV